jgi:hypothetical protein
VRPTPPSHPESSSHLPVRRKELTVLRMRSLCLLGVVAGVFVAVRVQAAPIPPKMSPEDALKKANVDGKYRMLLAQFKVDKDKEKYGEFKDLGFRNKREYEGVNDIPKGFWVYVHPYWYVWRDMTSVERAKRAWGPEQATGEPDTSGSGDIQTAWASASQDDQDEWLMLEYDEPVVPTAVLVYETFNPGALYRVTAFNLQGEEVELWKGADPTAVGDDKGISEIPVKADFKTSRIKIYLASKNVPGWNEIDAVGVRDKDKKMHWAVAADASSTYAPPYEDARPNRSVNEERLSKLEEDVRELKATIEELKKLIEKKNK